MTDSAVRKDILVGVDPREQSVPVLSWAVEEAARRRLPLRLSVSVPPTRDTHRVDMLPHYMALKEQGEKALAAAAEVVAAMRPEVPVRTELLDGAPAAVLCQGAARARMVVVGSRRLSRPEEILSASSVAVPVSARADCPVVVVVGPEPTGRSGSPHLVVGVDGSDTSRAAVAFAVEEASVRGASVHAVAVWHRPIVHLGDEAAAVEELRRVLSETVAGLGERYPDVEVTQEVLRGHPVEKLAAASAEALAVVVGRRGHGGYSGMRLGSVVHGLLHRAECPVITVPTHRHD
ncbi:universal stress protein [Streptomyces finlayi]|uniref:Universal stress protein n=1 Tax=Streptomyces finlayi TaxID=67296 RepID=A0A7G7BDF7_9ACTN|nr:universal stress protein [Streptomyces finlayi]QNE73372.1 universal stress protein [Streptomyces finlayi]